MLPLLLSRKHYKEYLVHEINVHALDPLLYMDKDEMLTVIRQSGMLADTPEQGDQLDEIYKGVLSEVRTVVCLVLFS